MRETIPRSLFILASEADSFFNNLLMVEFSLLNLLQNMKWFFLNPAPLRFNFGN